MVVEGDALICKVVLPGIAPQDVEVLVVGNQIVIKGERSDSRERRSGVSPSLRSSRLERRLSLPAGVSADQVTARYRDGVLEISMPAPRDVTTRRVPIEER
jgi:HSP20 family protein